jgi:hypothetical protein
MKAISKHSGSHCSPVVSSSHVTLPDTPGVVIIGKTIADRVFAGRDPIGRRIKYSNIESPGDLIVGVVVM